MRNPTRVGPLVISIGVLLIGAIAVIAFKNHSSARVRHYKLYARHAIQHMSLAGEEAEKYRNLVVQEYMQGSASYAIDARAQFRRSVERQYSSLIASEMKELSDPPIGCEELHRACLDAYSTHERFIAVAFNPTGNLETYAHDFRELAQTFVAQAAVVDSLDAEKPD